LQNVSKQKRLKTGENSDPDPFRVENVKLMHNTVYIELGPDTKQALKFGLRTDPQYCEKSFFKDLDHI
jgi:hypothetical protein